MDLSVSPDPDSDSDGVQPETRTQASRAGHSRFFIATIQARETVRNATDGSRSDAIAESLGNDLVDEITREAGVYESQQGGGQRGQEGANGKPGVFAEITGDP